MDDDEDDDDDDDDSKYGDFATKHGHTSGVDVPDNVPFAIAALFDSTIDPNPIQDDENRNDDGDEDDADYVQHDGVAPPLSSMQSVNGPDQRVQSIEEQYNQNVEHASNATIIVPGVTAVDVDHPATSITIIDPNDSRERSSTPPDKIGVAVHDNKSAKTGSPSPDDQALFIDYQLETVAKSNFVRRLSFPLGKIEEHPGLELRESALIDDDEFGALRHDNDDGEVYNDNNTDDNDNEPQPDDEDMGNVKHGLGDGEHIEELNDADIKRLSSEKESSVISELEADEKNDADDVDDDDDHRRAQIDRDRANREDEDDLYDGSAEHTESDFRGIGYGHHKESHDVDARTQQENEARLQQAKQQVDDLEQELKQQRDEMEREKMELINRTSTQIEMMRDELQTMCQHLQHKERTIHKLVHINREGYVPENDDFKYNASETQQQQQQQQQPNSDSRSSSLWSTAIRNGISSLTFARSKFSTPVHTLTETKQSKTDLAISSSREIDRLRSIIRTLSTKQTNAGPIRSSNLQNGKSALIDAEYEEVYPGGASN
mmetsp:Transcript_43218/g.71401  ORF Transcript_43218/g.71401 Transcript_43218/m.71401 type:complete len:547 (+) Transcript_43218:2-1642(+)